MRENALSEIHRGLCGSHIGFISLVAKAYKQVFYWPTTVKYAKHIIRTCAGCQYNAKVKRPPVNNIQIIPPMWLLARWGIDIVGPLLAAKGNIKFAIVSVKYFT